MAHRGFLIGTRPTMAAEAARHTPWTFAPARSTFRRRRESPRAQGSGPRTLDGDVIASGPVTQAATFLRGFDVAFSNEKDHHLGSLEALD